MLKKEFVKKRALAYIADPEKKEARQRQYDAAHLAQTKANELHCSLKMRSSRFFELERIPNLVLVLIDAAVPDEVRDHIVSSWNDFDKNVKVEIIGAKPKRAAKKEE